MLNNEKRFSYDEGRGVIVDVEPAGVRLAGQPLNQVEACIDFIHEKQRHFDEQIRRIG